jgi:tetratricopeptide (TPR) repeat protein
MLERLDDRFRLLAGPVGRGRPDRQATLRAALDWSWEMLGPDERAALTQLAVFEGGFSLAAAEAVVDAPGRAWVPDLLQALVDRSLLQCARPGRFELLRSVQDYAQTHGRPADAERRHWRHFAALAPEATGDDHEDLDNLVVACRRATAGGDAAAATRCLVAAWAQLRRRGPVRLGAELAQAVLAMRALAPADQARAAAVGAAALNVLNDPSGALAIAVCALELPEAGGAADRARLLSAAADAAAQLGEPAREEAFLARALELAQAPEVDVATRCAVFNALGAAAVDRHRGAEAQAWYRRGLEAARAAGDRRWQGALLGALGVQHHVAGQLDEAHALYREALALSTEVGDRRWEGSTRCNLGLVLLDQGRLEGAADELRQALALARAQGQPRLEMVSACNLGLVAMARDDPGQAADHLRTALAIARRLGDRRSAVQAHAYLAATLARAGRLDGAERELADGRAAAAGQDLPLDEGLLDAAEVELAARRGDPPRAQAALARLDALIAAQALGPGTELGRWRVRLAALSPRA